MTTWTHERQAVRNEVEKLIAVNGLKVLFHTDGGIVKAVDNASFDICREKTTGLVGESGCGKSVTARSIVRIIPPPGKIEAGQILYHEKNGGRTLDLATLKPTGKEMRRIRGKVISIIFQEPMTALSPVHTVGNQIVECIREHDKSMRKKEARERAIELLGEVGMPEPRRQIDAYTFELSGGMRQRAMIAIALAGGPELLIADEPTTAVDVTTQAKILDLLRKLKAESAMAMLFITHDLGIIAEMADDVAVMYLGKIVEKGTVEDIFDRPEHPYTQALLECVPKLDFLPKSPLATIRGSVPEPHSHPRGCPFANRCPRFMPGTCDQAPPALTEVQKNHHAACYLHSDKQE